jgi:L-malate glycosyltransferase
MKILLISNMYPSKGQPTYGVFVRHFVNQMTDCGVIVDKVVIEGRGYGLFHKLSKYWSFFSRASRSLRSSDYDLIYAHYIGHSLLPLLVQRRKHGRPLVVNAHGSDVFPVSKVSRLIKSLVKPVVRASDLIVVPSEYFSDVISKEFSLPKNKIFVSPSGGVDTSLFFPVNTMPKPSLLTVGYVSRIDPGKGWETLLFSLAKFAQGGTCDFRCLIIGGGSEVDKLLEMAKRLNLGSSVEYLGAVAHHELPRYYNEMDVFVFPTQREAESLGLVGLEALACGIPVIGSDIGALPSYIEHGRNGFLFPPGDSDRLFSCLERFVSLNESEVQNLKRNAAMSLRGYDSTSVGYALKDRLEKVLACGTAARNIDFQT